MPVTKSAIKAMKQNRKAKERNKLTKANFRGKVKVVTKAAHDGSKEIGKLTSEAIQAIDKAAKSGVIHKRTAARRKSRLMLALNKTAGKVVEPKTIKTEKAASTHSTGSGSTKKPATKKAATTRSTSSGSKKKTTTKKETK